MAVMVLTLFDVRAARKRHSPWTMRASEPLVRATKRPMDTNERIRKLAEEGGSVRSISRELGISRRQVAKALREVETGDYAWTPSETILERLDEVCERLGCTREQAMIGLVNWGWERLPD
jgi:hypothetical protein